MKVLRDTADPTKATVVGDSGAVLGYAQNVQEHEDGSLTFENAWPRTTWMFPLAELEGVEILDVDLA